VRGEVYMTKRGFEAMNGAGVAGALYANPRNLPPGRSARKT
jgi:NAD-dependent DNA ligase